MRTEMVIRMQASSEKCHSKAMQVAAAIEGVESVTLAGEGKNLLRVVGDGVDSNHLTSRLRRKVGHADIVELRTLHGRGYTSTTAGGGGGYYSMQAQALAGAHGDAAYGQYMSNYPALVEAEYYHHQPSTYEYYPSAPSYATTVVHHEYPTNDPSSCCIM